MSTFAPSAASRRGTPTWGGRLIGTLLVLVTGVVLGEQYMQPNKRVLPVLVAMLLFGLAWRMDMVTGLGVLVLAIPFPRGTTFGNTNFALILLLLVIWLLRMSQSEMPAPRRTPLDAPIAALLLIYVVSFYNIQDQLHLVRAAQNFALFAASLLMYYLVVNTVRTERQLVTLHGFMVISAVSLYLIGIYELNHPAAMFIRGWIDFTATIGSEFNTKDVRIGSMFHDYELLSEYCVLTLLLLTLRFARARKPLAVTSYVVLIVVSLFVLFATVTRGALVSGAIGMVYLLWLTRRRLNVVPFVIVGAGAFALIVGMDFYVSHFTRSGDLFGRLFRTQVVNGWMPETRAGTWTNAWARALVHPLIGQGPYYAAMKGYDNWWPHNVYLYYANILGFTGLGVFLWLMWRMLRGTWPSTDSLKHPSYARSYLLVAHVQLVIFMCNEFKIDYLRNPIYQFTVWMMFASMAAAMMIVRDADARAAVPAPAAEPVAPMQLAPGRA